MRFQQCLHFSQSLIAFSQTRQWILGKRLYPEISGAVQDMEQGTT
jgi:hypothetical protein